MAIFTAAAALIARLGAGTAARVVAGRAFAASAARGASFASKGLPKASIVGGSGSPFLNKAFPSAGVNSVSQQAANALQNNKNKLDIKNLGIARQFGSSLISGSIALKRLAESSGQATAALLSNKGGLGEFNATIAAANARLEVARIKRSVKSGSLLSQTAAKGLQVQNEFEEAFRPTKDVVNGLGIAFKGGLQIIATKFFQGVNGIADVLGEGVDAIKNSLGIKEEEKGEEEQKAVMVIEQLKDEAKKLRDNENWGRPF